MSNRRLVGDLTRDRRLLELLAAEVAWWRDQPGASATESHAGDTRETAPTVA